MRSLIDKFIEERYDMDENNLGNDFLSLYIKELSNWYLNIPVLEKKNSNQEEIKQ